MAADTNISLGGGSPQVTVRGANLVRYSCHFFLWKPEGQTWPDTGERQKEIEHVTLNKDQRSATFTLGTPASLTNLFLTWQIDMTLPGGVGGPLHYTVSVEIEQNGKDIMKPAWKDEGDIDTDVVPIADGTKLRVS